MSAWVCSARKFVVSSFVSFAEELEHAVLVLTDAEKALEYDTDLHASSLAPFDDSDEVPPAVMGAIGGVTKATVFLLDAGPASSEWSPLTTQPSASACTLSSTSSMTSLPSLSTAQTSFALIKSSRTSHSLPDISGRSKTTRLCVSSPNLKLPKTSKRHSQSASSRTTHQSYVHRSRRSTQSAAGQNLNAAGIDTLLSQNPLTLPSQNALTVQPDNPTTDKSALVIRPKRPRDRSLFTSNKRPGKVVRTSTNEVKSENEEEERGAQSTTISIHVIDNSEGWTQAENLQKNLLLNTQGSSPDTPLDIISPLSPEDIHIPNRSLLPALKQHPVEHIPRVSLVDKLSQIIHSTLVSISNMLRLESEDITAICRSARSTRSLQLQQAKELENEEIAMGESVHNSHGSSSTAEEEDYVDVASDNRLTISRINSLVSLESFEVLSKEDDSVMSCPTLPEGQGPSNPFHVSPGTTSYSEEHRERSAFFKDGELSDMQMASSIEFINFEVSDLITKRYFDSKTQRLGAFSPTAALYPSGQGPNLSNHSQVGGESLFQSMEEESGKIYGEKASEEKISETCLEDEGDDGSSASFDVISEDACQEPFNML